MFERLSDLARLPRLALASYQIFTNPKRLDAVLAAVSNLLPAQRAESFLAGIRNSSSVAARALIDKPTVKIDLDSLRTLPIGTLGRAVADHCDRWGIDPKAFVPRDLPGDFGWAVNHIEQSHDIWHAVTGFGSHEEGEIGLQAFYLAQFPALLALLLVGIANFYMLFKDPGRYSDLYDELTRGWLMGKRARPLFGLDWTRLWHRDLRELQAELGIVPGEFDDLIGPPQTQVALAAG